MKMAFKKKKLPKFTFKFKLLYVTLFYSFVSLMDIIIWLFSTAKQQSVLSFLEEGLCHSSKTC